MEWLIAQQASLGKLQPSECNGLVQQCDVTV